LIQSQPKLALSGSSIYPKPNRKASSLSACLCTFDFWRTEALQEHPTEAGKRKRIHTMTSLIIHPKMNKKRSSQPHKMSKQLIREERPSVLKQMIVSHRSTKRHRLWSPKARLTPLSKTAEATLDVVCVWVLPPGHRPNARHATRKLIAPPLRFFVLPAFLSWIIVSVPVCLSDTIRSRGSSPPQRLYPIQPCDFVSRRIRP
jgi:hypothetical protein